MCLQATTGGRTSEGGNRSAHTKTTLTLAQEWPSDLSPGGGRYVPTTMTPILRAPPTLDRVVSLDAGRLEAAPLAATIGLAAQTTFWRNPKEIFLAAANRSIEKTPTGGPSPDPHPEQMIHPGPSFYIARPRSIGIFHLSSNGSARQGYRVRKPALDSFDVPLSIILQTCYDWLMGQQCTVPPRVDGGISILHREFDKRFDLVQAGRGDDWKAAVLWRQSTLEGRPDRTKRSPRMTEQYKCQTYNDAGGGLGGGGGELCRDLLGDPAYLMDEHWPLHVFVMSTGITAFVTQTYLVSRYLRVQEPTIYLLLRAIAYAWQSESKYGGHERNYSWRRPQA
ncbi:hypothetical protein FB45DRAFT_869053 [Roridomyces roridus]|uniref:Uncharacterized protein n=1 Tax=Roridomyces roridus TaxID=1738132 RepID=A0AAD7BN38_9AGAR|nr:hypothetical protein FB45DRAFT_869053 [Roridomyces roridus]